MGASSVLGTLFKAHKIVTFFIVSEASILAWTTDLFPETSCTCSSTKKSIRLLAWLNVRLIFALGGSETGGYTQVANTVLFPRTCNIQKNGWNSNACVVNWLYGQQSTLGWQIGSVAKCIPRDRKAPVKVSTWAALSRSWALHFMPYSEPRWACCGLVKYLRALLWFIGLVLYVLNYCQLSNVLRIVVSGV